jgi:hypothetical protein
MLTWFRWATLMIALGAASYYGYRTAPWSCMDATVLAYWVAAIGTIGTLIGTIVIATSENRRRKKTEVDFAKLAAAGMLFKVRRVRRAVRAFNAMIARPAEQHEIDSAVQVDYAGFIQGIEDAGMWNLADVMPLIHLPNETAYNLEYARDRIAYCMPILYTQLTSRRSQAYEASVIMQSLSKIFEEAHVSLELAIREFLLVIPQVVPNGPLAHLASTEHTD